MPLRALPFLDALARALEVAAVGEDLDRDGEAIAARRCAKSRDVERQARDLRCLAAGDGKEPHLGRSRARGKKIDSAAVSRPVGRAVVLFVARDAPGRSVAVEVEQPQVGAAAVGGEVGFPQRVDDPLAVGRQRRLRETREADEIRRGQAVRRRLGDERNSRQGGSQQVPSHGIPPDTRADSISRRLPPSAG